ncbi:hypothetical protein M9H77_12954 [Catharanthus roseus]|uniref:Uncharacterized protein n=1 Tax=Catharanthus roseus TaxID=4058 RepID=A0ACC0BIS3_CATRO|nr:hypothetical protein M9H77_12954 [Catharanthus roseus]
MDPNLWRVPIILRVLSFYEEYQMFNFTLYSMNNDNDICCLLTIRPNISKEGIHVLHANVSTKEDHPNIPKHVTAITHMVSDEPSMLYPSVEEDDDDKTTLMKIMSYQVNLTTRMMIMMRKMTNALHDYTQSGAFLDIGSGELLDWNGAVTDIQLGIRFLDKIQAISAVQKWPIQTG